MYMANESIKEHWYWNLTRVAIATSVAGYIVFTVVLVVTLLTKDTVRLSMQDASTQACFVKPE